MLNFFKVILLLLLLGGCVGKKTDGRQGGAAANAGDSEKKEDGAKKATQPTNVGGGLDLHSIECSVSNRTDTAAQTTVVGCVFKDEKGKKFTGKITNVLASVYVNGSSTPVLGVATVLSADQTFSIAVSIPNLKPEDALSIKVGATLDGVVEEWLTSLLRDNVKATTANLDLYVDGTALNNGPLCTKELPCKQINLALSYVPSQIDHRVTIHIAEGRYDESISVIGRSITKKDGKLIFVGEDKSFSPKEGALVDLYPPTALLTGINISGLSNPNFDLEFSPATTFQNFRVNSSSTGAESANTYYSFGVYFKGSDALLKNVAVRGPWVVGVGAAFSSQISLNSVSISDFAVSGLYVYMSAQAYVLNGNLSLTTSEMESTTALYIADNGSLQLVQDEGMRPSIAVEFTGAPVLGSSQVGLLVEGGQVLELLNSFVGPPTTLTIMNASTGVKVDRGQVKLEKSDVSVSGCSEECIWATNQGTLVFAGNDSEVPAMLTLKASSSSDGAILRADKFGTLEVSKYVHFSLCNSLIPVGSEKRYIAAATINGGILTQIESPFSNYDDACDGGVNRFLKASGGGSVIQGVELNLRQTGDVFLSP